MADLTFTIPDDKVQVVLEAYAFLFNYDRYVDLQNDIGEVPMNRADYVREKLRQNLVALAREGHRRKLEAQTSVDDIDLE